MTFCPRTSENWDFLPKFLIPGFFPETFFPVNFLQRLVDCTMYSLTGFILYTVFTVQGSYRKLCTLCTGAVYRVHTVHSVRIVHCTVSEFNEFEPRLKSAKNRIQLSAVLNLEKLNTILSGANQN